MSWKIRPIRREELTVGQAFMLAYCREWVRRLRKQYGIAARVVVQLTYEVDPESPQTVAYTQKKGGTHYIYIECMDPHLGQLGETVRHEVAHILEGESHCDQDPWHGDGFGIRLNDITAWVTENNRYYK